MAVKKRASKKSSKKKATKSTKAQPTTARKTRRSPAKTKPKKQIGSCFVLMPFKEPFETYYSMIIKPAVTAAHLDVKRGDSLFTPTPIMGDVWKMIQDADVLVAELTDKNPNVFYELGLGHAIGKPIVLISETIDDVPFDLQQLRVILYDKDDPTWGNKLKTSITTALQETLQTPVEAVPPMFRKKVKSQAPADTETSIRLSALESKMSSVLSDLRHPRYSVESEGGIVRSRTQTSSLRESWKMANAGCREDAVQWALKAKHRYSLRTLRRFLIEQLAPEEADAVMKLVFE